MTNKNNYFLRFKRRGRDEKYCLQIKKSFLFLHIWVYLTHKKWWFVPYTKYEDLSLSSIGYVKPDIYGPTKPKEDDAIETLNKLKEKFPNKKEFIDFINSEWKKHTDNLKRSKERYKKSKIITIE